LSFDSRLERMYNIVLLKWIVTVERLDYESKSFS